MARSTRPSSRPQSQRGSKRPGSSRRGPGKVRAAGTQTTKREPAATRLTGRAIVLLSVVLLLLASYTSSLHAWWSQHQEIESTKASIAAKKAKIASLEKAKDRLDDDAYIEQQARRRFGWVMPGEVGYRVIGVDGKVEGDSPELDEPTGDKPREWYDKLWGSVTEADKKPDSQGKSDSGNGSGDGVLKIP